MQTIEVVYSPLCEASGAMIGKLRQWLAGTDIQIKVFPFHHCPQRLKEKFKKEENCFVDVFYNGNRIDCVPLHQEKIYKILNIQLPLEQEPFEELPRNTVPSEILMNALKSGEITFHPINCSNYIEEMSMCLCNYPFGNPPKQFHKECIAIKSQVFAEVWNVEEIAGIYAKYKDDVIGLLEVMPREILKKYGYMTGRKGEDNTYLSIGCYEVGYGFPRCHMIELLMKQLETFFPLFHRRYIEGVGIYNWNDGFNPYWVYEKYGFKESEKLSKNTVVMSKIIRG